jgi:hypothetical protein
MENTLLFVTMQTKDTVYANNVSLGIFLVEPSSGIFTFQNACMNFFFFLIIIDGYLGTCQVSRYFKVKIKTWCNSCMPFNALKRGYSQTNVGIPKLMGPRQPLPYMESKSGMIFKIAYEAFC